MEENNIKQLDLAACWKKILHQKKLFGIVLPCVLALSCILVLSIPRTYSSTVKLAPEASSSGLGSLGSLGAMASSFGIDLSSAMSSSDAISPELYPDMVSSMDFRTSLFKVKIKTQAANPYEGYYYDYLAYHQKEPWWTSCVKGVVSLFKKDTEIKGIKHLNAFMPTKEQIKIANSIDDKIECKVDKKTNVITISVTDQDPLVCATIADSVQKKIQQFIIDYRTKKAKNDLKYTQQLYENAKAKYVKSRQKYGAFGDANEDLVLQSYKLKSEDLENDMQLQFNSYQALATQLQAAKAKVQERTPAFTILQTPYVPVKPVGPKRMLIVFLCMAFTTLGLSFYSINKK